MTHPEIPEELKGTPKQVLDVVFASGPDGERYAIPLDLARQHPDKSDHPAVLSAADLANEGEDEVSGHHAVGLSDGTYGYHANWCVGPYIWHANGRSCYGLHRHPFGWTNPLAMDEDDL